jgi:hypothetical protein
MRNRKASHRGDIGACGLSGGRETDGGRHLTDSVVGRDRPVSQPSLRVHAIAQAASCPVHRSGMRYLHISPKWGTSLFQGSDEHRSTVAARPFGANSFWVGSPAMTVVSASV